MFFVKDFSAVSNVCHLGNTDSHENILSPSALEKMVSGLDHMDGSDMADLFSDVLSHHQEGSNKQGGLI